jgi:hypothetical protein
VGREGPLGHLADAIRLRCEHGKRSICPHTLVHNAEGIIGHCLGCPQITAVHSMQALHRRDGVDATRGPERCAQSTRRSTGFVFISRSRAIQSAYRNDEIGLVM